MKELKRLHYSFNFITEQLRGLGKFCVEVKVWTEQLDNNKMNLEK